MADLSTRALFLLGAAAVFGCGDDASGATGGAGGDGSSSTVGAATGSTGSTTATGGDTGGGSAGGGDAGAGGGGSSDLQTLMSTDWSLEPGTEIYLCTRITFDEDLWISEFHPVIPVGTHHTVVTLAEGGSVPDGTRECLNPFEGGPRNIYGTGVGTEPLVMPDGVAVKIPAGQQVVLNLHLFNAGVDTLSGTSGVEFLPADPAAVENEASSDLIGMIDFVIEPNGTTTEEVTCTVANDLTLFAMLPHMHQMGRHLRFTHTPAGGDEVVLFDGDYDFDAQHIETYMPNVELVAGDTISVACTWDNATSDTVGFGESTEDEMCFAGVWIYPANQVVCSY